MTKPSEQLIKQGICPECDSPMKAWTQDEIDAAKDDLGMDKDDDFSDVCDECMKQYLPKTYTTLLA